MNSETAFLLESVKTHSDIAKYLQGASAILLTLLHLVKDKPLEPRVKDYLKLRIKSIIRNEVDLSNPIKILSMMRDLQLPVRTSSFETTPSILEAEGAAEADIPLGKPPFGSEEGLFKKFIKNLLGDSYYPAVKNAKSLKNSVGFTRAIALAIIATVSVIAGKHFYNKKKESDLAKKIIEFDVKPMVERLVDLIIEGKVTSDHHIDSVLRKLEDSVIDRYNLMNPEESVSKEAMLSRRWSGN